MLIVRAAVLVSGGGTNLQALLDAQAAGRLSPAEISLVVSNRRAAFALDRARGAGVETAVLSKPMRPDPDRYDDQTFTVTGDGTPPLVLDHEPLKDDKVDPEVAAQFEHLDQERGDCIVACGWVMAEELLKYG